MTQASAFLPGGLPDPETRPDFYAGVALRRGLAWIIDTLVTGIAAILFLPFTAFLGLLVFPALMLTIGFFYRWITLANGSATWGMRFVGITIREADGGPLGSGAAFAHTAGYTFCVLVAPLQLISIGLMLVTARGQGLPDLALGTAAINQPLHLP